MSCPRTKSKEQGWRLSALESSQPCPLANHSLMIELSDWLSVDHVARKAESRGHMGGSGRSWEG